MLDRIEDEVIRTRARMAHLFFSGRSVEAILEGEKVPAGLSDARFCGNLATAWMDQAEWGRLESLVAKALAIEDRYALMWRIRGALSAGRGELDSSRDELRKSLRCSPHPHTHMLLAETLFLEGERENAAAEFRKGEALIDRYLPPSPRLKSRMNDQVVDRNFGALLEHLGRPREALEQYRRVLEEAPGDGWVHDRLAGLLREERAPEFWEAVDAGLCAPIAALDCGERCTPYNEGGVPFCCDTRHTIPSAYQAEWEHLQVSSDLWHAYEPPDPKTVTFAYRHSIQMSEDGFVQTKSALKDLVDLRNDLVHHLIERFDLWSDEGCVAAGHHLQASYTRIDGHFAELRQWATSMDDARAMHASFMQTEVFQDFLVNGIAPDGTIDWAAAGIVSVLREAGGELKQGDWTCLDDAVAWIGERHSEQTPAKYGCKSWPDVLHKSRAFDLEYRPDATGRKVGWYRERV